MKRGEQGPLYRAVDEGGSGPAPTGADRRACTPRRAIRSARTLPSSAADPVVSTPARLGFTRCVSGPVSCGHRWTRWDSNPTGSDAAGVLRDYEHDGPSTATDEVA